MRTSFHKKNDNRKIKKNTNLKSDLKGKQDSNKNVNSRSQVKTINAKIQKKINEEKNNNLNNQLD